MFSGSTMIIHSILILSGGGGMLKAIDFPLCSFDIHPNRYMIRGVRERELVSGYYYRLTSHSHIVVYGARQLYLGYKVTKFE